MNIERLKLGASSAYLVRGERPILVDAGNLGEGERVERALLERGVRPGDLALVLLTHAHGDHFGDAPRLRERFRAPIALHRADLPLLGLGREPELRPTGPLGRIMRPLFRSTFRPFEPDLVFEGTLDLAPFGVAGEAVETPGHTAGSVSVRLEGGDAIVGDLVRGSFVRSGAPRVHLFADDLREVARSLARLLALGEPRRVFAGHGEPFGGAALRRFAARLARRNGGPQRA